MTNFSTMAGIVHPASCHSSIWFKLCEIIKKNYLVFSVQFKMIQYFQMVQGSSLGILWNCLCCFLLCPCCMSNTKWLILCIYCH
jgi:hypothetical protein